MDNHRQFWGDIEIYTLLAIQSPHMHNGSRAQEREEAQVLLGKETDKPMWFITTPRPAAIN